MSISSILNSEEYFIDVKLNPYGADGYKDCITQAFKITNNALSLYGFQAEEVAGRYSLHLTVNGTKIKFNVLQNEEIDLENLIKGLNKVLEEVNYKEGKKFVAITIDDAQFGIAFLNDKRIQLLDTDQIIGDDVSDIPEKVNEIKTETPLRAEELFNDSIAEENQDPVLEEKPLSTFEEIESVEPSSPIMNTDDAPLHKPEEVYNTFEPKEEIQPDQSDASVNDLLDQLLQGADAQQPEDTSKWAPKEATPTTNTPSTGETIKDFDVDKFMGFTPSETKRPETPINRRPINTPSPKTDLHISEAKKNEMRQYSDYRLLNTVKQSNNYSKEDVAAAILILDERGITTKAESSKMGKLPQYVKYAEMQLKRGVGPQIILRDLQQRGMPPELAREALSKATTNARNSRSSSSSGGGMGAWGWIIVIFVIIRIIALIARN